MVSPTVTSNRTPTGHRGTLRAERHPIYTAMAGWAAGFALVTANWIFVAFAVRMPAVFFLRVPREEKMMLDQFGGEYREYMKRTGRVFPKF